MQKLSFPQLITPLGFYAVVPTLDWVKKCVHAGVHTVQLRNKDLQGDALKAEIQGCVDACRGSQTQLFINDYWQLAIECGAYGVHLGQEDMDVADLQALALAGVRLGLSTH
jgi:thiamine-phosphate pyrophosphorylase